MDCTEITADGFKRHMSQFIHSMRENGFFRNSFKEGDKNTPAFTVAKIAEEFNDDAKNMIATIEDNIELKYNMKQFFNVDRRIDFSDILEDWKIFFGLLGIRFLGCKCNYANSEIKKIVSKFYNDVKDL